MLFWRLGGNEMFCCLGSIFVCLFLFSLIIVLVAAGS